MTNQRAVEWMAERGRLGYRAKIERIRAILARGNVSERWVARLEREIADVEQAAFDRYQDWATDPLP